MQLNDEVELLRKVALLAGIEPGETEAACVHQPADQFR